MKSAILSAVAIFLTIIAFVCVVEGLGGCTDDDTCTDLCGYAGRGTCVNKTHCVCQTCPQRSTAELSLAYAVKVCTIEPMCQLLCPASSLSLTNGKIYSGHLCSTVNKPGGITCICFCMPTTLESLSTVLECPVVPSNLTAISSFTNLLG